MKLALKKRIVSRNVNKPEPSFNTNLVLQRLSDKTNCFGGKKKRHATHVIANSYSDLRIRVFAHKKKLRCAKKNIHNRFFDVPLEIKP